jgi:DNA-binding response OmpR family regulator
MKVLLIDDDVDFSESIATFLTIHGHTVMQARDATQGVALAAAERPDIILCDIMMRERTEGFFAVQQLRRTPGIERTPIFVISSVYADIPVFRIEPHASWLGHDEFIAKPIDPADLLRRIESTTARQGST